MGLRPTHRDENRRPRRPRESGDPCLVDSRFRGNDVTFDGGRVYPHLLAQAVKLHGAAVVRYCLMSNQVRGVVVPHQAEALAATFKQVHGRYAWYWNVAHAGSRRHWQGRSYSCPLPLGECPSRLLTPRTPDILAPWDHGL